MKDLACLSNSFGELEYNMTLKVLKRILVRKHHGIVILSNVAGKKIVPASVRSVSEDRSGANSGESETSDFSVPDDTGVHILTTNLPNILSARAKLFSPKLAPLMSLTMQNDWIFSGCPHL